jgi:undecaprenyl-diphosphatase
VALVSALACAFVVSALALLVHHVQEPLLLDRRANKAIYFHARLPLRAVVDLNGLGTGKPFVLSVAVLFGAALLFRDRLMAVVALVGPPLALLLAESGKVVIGRHEGQSLGSFPSGHTASLAAVATVATLVLHRRWQLRMSLLAVPVFLLLTGAMTIAVVQDRAHLMSDAIAGDLLGFGTVVGSAWLLSMAVLRVRAQKAPPEQEALACAR